MNFIENGSFESGKLAPWIAEFDDPEKIILSEHHAALLPVGMQIRQVIEPTPLQGLETLVFKVNARAQMAAAETRKVNCRFRFGIRAYYDGHLVGDVVDFDATGGMQQFQDQVTLIPAQPLRSLEVLCWVIPFETGPEHDLRDIWFSGFELVAETRK